jgi:diguanylate cyclase (GGDEF)-like protein
MFDSAWRRPGDLPMIGVVGKRDLTLGLANWLANGCASVRALPAPARLWWAITLLAAILLVPEYLPHAQAGLPLPALLLAGVLNFVLVLATGPRRHRASMTPSFDYGGIATVALLAGLGPVAAYCAFVGEKLAGATLRDRSGNRPPFLKTSFNLAWGTPCIVFSWSVGSLVPDHSLAPIVVAAAFWFSNSLVVGVMAGLAQRRPAWQGLWLGLTQEGWLRLQEAMLSILAVIAWWTNPLLVLAVVLLVIGQAATGRRLLLQHEAAASAREQANEERQRAALEAERARHDPLTGLANRRAFEEILAAGPSPVGVLMLDLDHFKGINDTYGHDVGDQVLVSVARLLEVRLTGKAVCARLGGEEFCALVLEPLTETELVAAADSVRVAVKDLRLGGVPQLRVTASVGVARQTVPAVATRELIGRADQALYRAKREGRDRVAADAPESLPLAS